MAERTSVDRISLLERKVERLEEDQDEIRSEILVDLGTLKTNDENQDKKIAKLEASMDELLKLKITIEANFRLLKGLVVLVPMALAAVAWALGHVHL